MKNLITKKEVLFKRMNILMENLYSVEILKEMTENRLENLKLDDFNKSIVKFSEAQAQLKTDIQKCEDDISTIKDSYSMVKKIYEKGTLKTSN